MNAAMPSTARQQFPLANLRRPWPPRGRPRHPGRGFMYAAAAICVVQATLSLTLVWSNTAYTDEADDLWIGRLEIAHWLHGTSWPSASADRILPGSPVIYPPLGALADSMGGLAGARILSVVFMLGATVLLYLTASRLIGRRGAVVSAALWALSEPAIRLAFANFDPLSDLLTALSAWLIVQAAYRCRSGAFVTAAAAALALANVTAYTDIVIDPVVIAFAFLVWLPRMRPRRASFYTVWLTEGLMVFFCLLMMASRSWPGLLYTVFARNIADYQSITVILSEILGFSGLVIALAVTGGIIAVNTESRSHAALLVLLACAAFIVPAAQLHDQTAWSIDKHLAYGIWFAAIPAGYACSKLIQWVPASMQLTTICCVIILTYTAVASWQSAWAQYQTWPDAGAFISAFKPIAGLTRGSIYMPGNEANIAEYYTPQGRDWTRWSAALSLDPAVPSTGWERYYTKQLDNGNYGLIVLFYSTTFSSAPDLPEDILLSPHSNRTNQELLGLVADNAGEPGLSQLTLALEDDPDYRLSYKGPYDSAHDNGIYAIWQKKAQS